MIVEKFHGIGFFLILMKSIFLGKEKALLRQSKTWRKIFIYEQ